MIRSRRFAAACLALCLAGLPSSGLAQACVSRGEARQLLEQGLVVPLPEAMQQAGVEGGVVEAELCRGGGGYSYRVRLRQNGQVRVVNIPAG